MRLGVVADKLELAAEHLTQSTQPLTSANLAVEVRYSHTNEHTDDVEVPTAIREE